MIIFISNKKRYNSISEKFFLIKFTIIPIRSIIIIIVIEFGFTLIFYKFFIFLIRRGILPIIFNSSTSFWTLSKSVFSGSSFLIAFKSRIKISRLSTLNQSVRLRFLSVIFPCMVSFYPIKLSAFLNRRVSSKFLLELRNTIFHK